jgi:hypothetical protein
LVNYIKEAFMNIPTPDPNLTTSDVLEALRASGKPLREWGQAIDGTPMLAARTGGDKQPAIFVTAGAHATETAGVHAALNLVNALDTEHEAHVLPLRDPLGFAGVNHCLSFAAGQPVELPDNGAVLDYLSAHGQLVWRKGDLQLFKLGDLGFFWDRPRPGPDTYWDIHRSIRQLLQDNPQQLKPLFDKRIMLIDAWIADGAGPMQRCFHIVLKQKQDGEWAWLHLNRFFGRDDAPPEVAALDRLMQTVRPGLTCDLHEGNGEGFWLPVPTPKENPERLFDMTKAFLDYVKSQGYPVASYEDILATDHTRDDKEWMRKFQVEDPRLPGLLWSQGLMRGEGPNMMGYGGRFGIGYGTEAPLKRPLAMRVDGLTNGIQAAIKVWEQTV